MTVGENNIETRETPLVYSRRKQDNVIDPISLSHSQSSTPETGTAHPLPPSSSFFESNLDIPIAIRKGVVLNTLCLILYFIINLVLATKPSPLI